MHAPRQMPLEGESHTHATFKRPPPELYADSHIAPSGPRNEPGFSPQRPWIPFEGSSHTQETFAPPPPEAYLQVPSWPPHACPVPD